MKINWKVRFKNPQFWINLSVSIIGILLAYLNVNWEQMTSWPALGQLFVDAVKNPVIVFAVLACIWNAVCDPTTAGIGDSHQALKYTEPKR